MTVQNEIRRRTLSRKQSPRVNTKGNPRITRRIRPTWKKGIVVILIVTVDLTVRHTLSVCDAGSDKWIIDSGATCHMSMNRSQFSDYRPLEIPLGVTLGDGHHLKAVGCGSVTLEVEMP